MEKIVTDANFAEIIGGGMPVMVDFWATWCGPCRMIAPVVEELAGEYEGKVVIGKCNVDENNDVSSKFGIRSIPTVLFFKGGKLMDKQVGSTQKATYMEKLEALL